MATTDHIAAARAGLAVDERDGLTTRQLKVAAAQAHATLAVAEELRTANLIALAAARHGGEQRGYDAVGGVQADQLFAEAHQRLTGGEQS